MPHRLHGLYAITDPLLLPGERLFTAVRNVLEGGCRILQYRNKQASRAQRLDEAIQLRLLCQQYGALLLINDDAELVLATNADGLHIGQSDLTLAQARHLLGNDRLIGVSCHDSLELAKAAAAAGADYIALGRFFPSQTKPDAPPARLDTLAAACRELTVPVVAIGGITLDNAASVIQRGAHMVAVINDVFAATDITHQAQQYNALFRTHAT